MSTFKVGDKVRHYKENIKGVIKQVTVNMNLWVVQWETGDKSMENEQSIILIEQTAPARTVVKMKCTCKKPKPGQKHDWQCIFY